MINKMRFAKSLLNYSREKFQILPSDRFIVSYPKSGNTWVRFLVANMINTKKIASFNNIEDIIPDIHISRIKKLERLPNPRILKSHEYLVPDYNNIVYLVRDPRDVAVSFYFFKKKIGHIEQDLSIGEFVKMFVYGKLSGFGNWSDHVGGWVGARGNESSFLCVRYEDLLDDTVGILRQIASHLSIEMNLCDAENAVEKARLDRMKRSECDHIESWKGIKSKDESIPFVREGGSGSWKKYLSRSDKDLIQNAWGDLMEQFGYPEV